MQVGGVSADRHRHRDTDTGMGTGTWTWADWKCEHKNKVKREMTTHQTYCRGRQAGVATTGVARHGAQAGRQVDAGQDAGTGRCVWVGRCEHREVQA